MHLISNDPKRLALAGLLLGAVLLAPQAAMYGQGPDLALMPASVVNQPDYDLFGLRRPALSLTGFDNTEPGYDPAFGLGLKQVLVQRLVEEDPLVVPVFDRLVDLAHEVQQNPYVVGGADLSARRYQLERNTVILQGRAFEALATFALELNGHHPPDLHPGLRTHGEALAAFREALAAPPGGLIVGDWLDDYVKYTQSVVNVARAVDLYLALENAYLQVLGGLLPPFAGLRPDLLLTLPEREALMTEFGTALLIQETVLTTRAVDLYAAELVDLFPPDVVEQLLWKLDRLPAGDRAVEEVEAGNWAMKQRASAGYGALAMQMAPDDPYAPVLRALPGKAFRSLTVSHQGDKSRLRHWNWMTYAGRRFWPESNYYLDFALEEVLAFWHAARAGGLVEGRDPFFSSWFTNALAWHADLVTPDGSCAAMDDGNKNPIRHAGLMRWSEGYGDAGVGRKFAWIEDVLGGPARTPATLLLELAVPRTGAAQAPPERVGNPPGPIRANRSEQQLIVRSTPPGEDTHFLFLNGEHGVAVDRGEGHEQADQLNLLYYVGAASYLADSGYDRGYTVPNSFWNHYYDHNVMTAGGGEGGLEPPMLDILDVRKSSEPDVTGQVDALYFEDVGRVTLLHGEQMLRVEPEHPYKADYTRDVLFVHGADPYVIDLNRISQRVPPATCEANVFRMRYHVNSGASAAPSGYTPRGDGFVRWNDVDGQAGLGFALYPMSVEFELGPDDVRLVPDQILEKEDPVHGKHLADIDKLVLAREDRCEPFWTVAALLHAVPAAAPSEAPALLWPASDDARRQGWVWARGGGAFDVFAARSVADPQADVSFDLADAGAGYPDFRMTLPKGRAYGFARVRDTAGGWAVDPDYVVGFTSDAPAAKAPSDGVEPVAYGLSEAYPNPFNPATAFTLRLREAESVKVEVYDVTGRRVALLHDGPLAPGAPHTFRVDASRWAGGAYLLLARGETFRETRTLMLLK